MNKNRNKQGVNNSNPPETHNDSTAPSDSKGQQPNRPNEGNVRKVNESSTDAARFDDNYEVAEDDAISEDEMRSEDENNS